MESGETGVECNQLVSPFGNCAAGSSISTVTFMVEFCSCDESDNLQGGECVDEGALPTEGSVRITCSDSDDSLLFSQNVEAGDLITMSANL